MGGRQELLHLCLEGQVLLPTEKSANCGGICFSPVHFLAPPLPLLFTSEQLDLFHGKAAPAHVMPFLSYFLLSLFCLYCLLSFFLCCKIFYDSNY